MLSKRRCVQCNGIGLPYNGLGLPYNGIGLLYIGLGLPLPNACKTCYRSTGVQYTGQQGCRGYLSPGADGQRVNGVAGQQGQVAAVHGQGVETGPPPGVRLL